MINVIFKTNYFLLSLLLVSLLIFQVDFAFAATPTLISDAGTDIDQADALTSTITIPNVAVGTQLDRFLSVGVSLDNHDTATRTGDTTVQSVTFGPTGTSCSVNQSLTLQAGSVRTTVDELRNEIWTLTNPTQSQTCNIVITLNADVGFDSGFDARLASASYALFSGVDQTTSIVGTGVNNFGNSGTPSVTIASTVNQYAFDIMSSRSTTGAAPTIGANQVVTETYFNSGVGLDFLFGSSTQSGNLDTAMSWTFANAADWVSSAIVINSCDVSASCSVVSSSTSSSGGSCSGDCTPPTLGIDKINKQIVSNGFSFNGNSVDSDLYYTHYPLITTYVGEENTISLSIYEDSGPQNLAHVSIAFGLGTGESFNESKAMINWDRSFDRTESVTIFDPENVFDNVRVDVEEKQCESISGDCSYITVYHTFRAPLEFNMVSTNIWDHDRNAWQNYFNDGIQIVGESLNPPKEYDGIYKGKIYHLTETEKNSAIDDDGNTWTFDYGIWNKDYIPIIKSEPDLINYEKIEAIQRVMQDKPLDDISESFIYDRHYQSFAIHKDYQLIIAESVLEELCPKCLDDSFEEIDDIHAYEFETKDRINSELTKIMNYESVKAEKILDDMMASLYPAKVFD
jgi:hypothetical protein